MKEYILENIQTCCDAFQELLLEDRYLSRRDLDRFLDEYDDTFCLINKGYLSSSDILYKKITSIVNDGYNVISKRNMSYINRKMKELSSYFDDLFVDVDSSVKLDEEQRKVIISDEDYSLVTAPPGTGKTTVAIAKIKYLIEKRKVDPKSIYYVCPSIKASREIKDILNDIFDVSINVLTINELAIHFLDETYKETHNISNYDNMQKLIYGYIKNVIFTNKEKLELLCSCFSNKLRFKNEYLDYKTYNDYYDNYMDNQYELYKKDIDKYILNKVGSLQKQYRSIKGDYLRCLEEVEIANYLYINGIDYEYYLKENINDYVPDFIINSNGKNIYIEYYGLTGIKDDGTYYVRDRNLKRNLKIKQNALRKKYKDSLIEIYNNMDSIIVLADELEKRGIKKKPLSNKSIFYQLLGLDKDIEFKDLVHYISKFIKKFKEEGKGPNDFDDLIRNQFNTTTKKQLVFIRDIMDYYDNYLENNNMVDGSSLVLKATAGLEKLKHDSDISISYLFLDDYQYLDLSQTMFAKKISSLFDTKIIALGDDYETIFAMGQNDVDLFKEFYNIMGYGDIMRISTLYRRSQDVIDVGTNYTGTDLSNISKNIISSKMDKPIEIDYYNKSDIYDKYLALDYALTRIDRENKGRNILILSPFEDSMNEYVSAGYFKKGQNGLLLYNNNPKLHIEFHTVLDSVGLEFDNVILLADNRSYLFDDNDELLDLISNEDDDLIENYNDRKLFYISLTRTKNKLYIICPRNSEN